MIHVRAGRKDSNVGEFSAGHFGHLGFLARDAFRNFRPMNGDLPWRGYAQAHSIARHANNADNDLLVADGNDELFMHSTSQH
jgi:hypothetical protein